MARVKIAVVGCGYVGLVTALGFARAGAEVLAVEVDPARRAALRAGRVPFGEPGLGALLREVAPAVEGSVEAVAGADLVCVAVPTAPDASDPTEGVVRAAVRAGVGGVVLRGTLTPERAAALAALAPTVANPEFLREGHALADFLAPARVVIGGDAGVAARLVELYARILDPGVPVVCTDLASACVAKLAANAMLAVRVAFANEVGRWASASGASVVDVLHVVGLDPRIGPSHLRPSLGFGGPCLPKDARMLAPHSRLVAAALECNDDQLRWAEQAAAGAA
ncbi:MAG: nucleotide sugar dehydrogenase, partial [Myxococcota bacterium]